MPTNFGIELGNGLGRADGHVELDIGDAKANASEAGRIGLEDAHGIAPGAGRLDIIVVLAEGEFGVAQFRRHRGEPVEQRLAPGDDEGGMAAQHLRRASRQVKLAPADIHPHVGVADHQIGVAGQPKARDIEQRRQPLVGDQHVDMLEMDGIAEVLGGAVKSLLLHGRGSPMFWGPS